MVLDILAKWEDVGLEMGLKPGKLTEFGCDKSNIRSRMRAVLLEWLHGNGTEPASYQSLIDILNSDAVFETDVATAIKDKITKKVQDDIN